MNMEQLVEQAVQTLEAARLDAENRVIEFCRKQDSSLRELEQRLKQEFYTSAVTLTAFHIMSPQSAATPASSNPSSSALTDVSVFSSRISLPQSFTTAAKAALVLGQSKPASGSSDPSPSAFGRTPPLSGRSLLQAIKDASPGRSARSLSSTSMISPPQLSGRSSGVNNIILADMRSGGLGVTAAAPHNAPSLTPLPEVPSPSIDASMTSTPATGNQTLSPLFEHRSVIQNSKNPSDALSMLLASLPNASSGAFGGSHSAQSMSVAVFADKVAPASSAAQLSSSYSSRVLGFGVTARRTLPKSSNIDSANSSSASAETLAVPTTRARANTHVSPARSAFEFAVVPPKPSSLSNIVPFAKDPIKHASPTLARFSVPPVPPSPVVLPAATPTANSSAPKPRAHRRRSSHSSARPASVRSTDDDDDDDLMEDPDAEHDASLFTFDEDNSKRKSNRGRRLKHSSFGDSPGKYRERLSSNDSSIDETPELSRASSLLSSLPPVAEASDCDADEASGGRSRANSQAQSEPAPPSSAVIASSSLSIRRSVPSVQAANVQSHHVGSLPIGISRPRLGSQSLNSAPQPLTPSDASPRATLSDRSDESDARSEDDRVGSGSDSEDETRPLPAHKWPHTFTETGYWAMATDINVHERTGHQQSRI